MSKLRCTEAVYDTLAAAGLRTDHASFDDIIMAAIAMATDPACPTFDLVAWIDTYDSERTEEDIALDLVEYLRCSGVTAEVFEQAFETAVERGKAGWAA